MNFTPDLRKLVGRSLFTHQPSYITIDGIVYAFTAGATERIITAEVLAPHPFLDNEVFVRTNGDLYLTCFKHLNDLEAELPPYFKKVNRGVLINGLRIGFPGDGGRIGFRLLDHQGRRHEEQILLSDKGRHALDEFIVTPRRRRPHPGLNLHKTALGDSLSPGN